MWFFQVVGVALLMHVVSFPIILIMIRSGSSPGTPARWAALIGLVVTAIWGGGITGDWSGTIVGVIAYLLIGWVAMAILMAQAETHSRY